MSQSLQDQYAPNNQCFGCGPANEKGLRIKSRVENGEVVCDFTPEPHHHAFPGMLNGGIIGALLDCHSNWTGAMALMKARGEAEPPCTVTSEFHVKLRRPTPSGRRPAMKFSSVVLPQPLGPTIETNSPGFTRSENSFTATSSPNTTDTLSSTTEPVGAPDIGSASADADAA